MEEERSRNSLCAVVVTYNSQDLIGDCLRSLLAQVPRPHVIVVDNASTDSTVDTVREGAFEDVQIIVADRNTGFAGGCNRGYREAAGAYEWLAFLNPDVTLETNCLLRCRELLESNFEIGCVAPLLMRTDGETVDSAGQLLNRWTLEVHDRGYGQRMQESIALRQTVLAACGAAAVFRCSALQAIAVDDEPWSQEFFCFWEDLEIGWRLSNRGWRIVVEPEAVAYHLRGGGAEPGRGRLRWRRPPALEACVLTNRWITMARHLHMLDLMCRLPILLIWDTLAVVLGLVRRPVLARYLVGRLPLVLSAVRTRQEHPRRRLGDLLC
ncbi:MAG: glycosyltransferase family 2 protein [bacterium]|nr:glycosyltransferase family 2 protein [bacterium]